MMKRGASDYIVKDTYFLELLPEVVRRVEQEIQNEHTLKRAEEALANELIRHTIPFEQSSDGIVVLDQDGKVVEANQRYAEMLGYSAEEVLHLHAWDWDTQWSREQLLEKIQRVDAVGDHFETCHRCKDGSYYDVEISSNGAIVGGRKLMFCVCRDITERKRMEQALREGEEHYRALFEHLPIPAYTKNREGEGWWFHRGTILAD